MVEKTGEVIPELIRLRLYKKGTDGDGTILRTDRSIEQGGHSYYSESYTKIKRQSKPVDLNRTGKFYKSISIKVKDSFFYTRAAFLKGGEHIGVNFTTLYSDTELFEVKILKVSEEEKNIYTKKYFLPNFLLELRK